VSKSETDHFERKTCENDEIEAKPLQNFDVRCLHCDSYYLKLSVQYDESDLSACAKG
jgi:hypothetical protein